MFANTPSNWHPQEVSTNVSYPQVGGLQRVFDSLASLVHPKPIAYCAPEFSTRVDHFSLRPEESLVPVSIVASARRLFCYSAQYGDGSQSVVLLVGESVQQALRGGVLCKVFSDLATCSRRHGLVVSHLLASINTPTTLGEFRERAALLNSRDQFRELLLQAVRSDIVSPPPLDVLNVNLDGWQASSGCPCRCVFEGMPNGTGVLLRIQWRRGDEGEQRIALIGRDSVA